MGLENVYKIMTQLENTSGKLAKEQILKENEGEKDFREALYFLLNPYIVTGISTKKMNKVVNGGKFMIKQELLSMSQLISFLKENNTGTDYNVCVVQMFANKQKTPELQTFVTKFVTKDLKLGISEKTVNKVYGKGTIPTFAVMLAESYAKKEAKVTGDFYVTLKLDGNRCVAIKDSKGVKFFTRKGQPVEHLHQLEDEFKKLPNGVYDGELLLVNKDNLPSDELFRATQKVVRKDGEKKELEFHVFDHLSDVEFKDGKSKKTYEQRRNTLDLLFSKLSEDTIGDLIENIGHTYIKLLPVLYKGNDKSKIAVLMKWAEENGYEGLMVNTATGLYQSKRTVDLLKVKNMKTADLLCISFEKAIDGQFKDILARINVEYKGNVVGVGSGFTIEERKHFTENPDDIVGKIIEVQFFEESTDDKTKLPSLRFPVYKGIRHDKGLDDVNYGE